jgi:hypothetical protein
VSECDPEASLMRRLRPTRSCSSRGGKYPAISVAMEFQRFYSAIINAVCTFMSRCFGYTGHLAYGSDIEIA